MPFNKEDKKVGAILDLFRELDTRHKGRVITLLLEEGKTNSNEITIEG